MTLSIEWSSENISESDGAFVSAFSEHVLRFDAVTKESHELTSMITEHSVEGAAAISDHKRPNPRRLSLEVQVTNTPIGEVLPSGYEEFRPPSSAILPQGQVSVLQFNDTFDRVSDVFQTLKRLASEPTLLTVIASTGLEVYENMTIVSVSAPREFSDGNSITFSIELVEVLIAEARLVDSPEPREVRGSRRRDAGTQEPDESAPESTSERARSLLTVLNDDGPSAFLEAGAEFLGFGG